ncbi:hypothetical protein MUK42_13014 [Musa troglodytarum]|uniref:Uncharacterized protein n=1 Tax=Musa troglodytarum TaxID=320322 RepID=A0A9E7F6S9_9LILI|nr:hypothetical protein MUK42_13014 [Musa troglodytarum]
MSVMCVAAFIHIHTSPRWNSHRKEETNNATCNTSHAKPRKAQPFTGVNVKTTGIECIEWTKG